MVRDQASIPPAMVLTLVKAFLREEMNRVEATDTGVTIEHERRVFVPRGHHLVDERFRSERRSLDTRRIPLVFTAHVDEANGARFERFLNVLRRDFHETPPPGGSISAFSIGFGQMGFDGKTAIHPSQVPVNQPCVLTEPGRSSAGAPHHRGHGEGIRGREETSPPSTTRWSKRST